MHYYKRNIGDYAKKAGRLSMLQHGAYTLILDSCYDREQFPTREQAIEWAWASSKEEIEAVDFVLSRFFIAEEDGTYTQTRVLEELLEYAKFCEIQAEKGKMGGRPPKANGLKNKPGGFSNKANGKPDESQCKAGESLTTNQEPLTSITDTNVSVVGAVAPPACPHLEIIAAYNRILPELQHVIPDRWSGARADALKSRWRESPKHQSVQFWERFFNELRRWPFYMGENDRQWKADLGWIVKRANFDKLIEKFTSARKAA